MTDISKFKSTAYGTLLGINLMDATTATSNKTQLKINKDKRTIIIGIGGTGVKTINTVKGTISKRFQPGWEQYVSFIGIDTSWTELENSAYLDKSEWTCTTSTGINARVSNPASYPSAIRKYMIEGSSPDSPVAMGDLATDGAGMTRLIGKVKIHDKDAASATPGVDEQIVAKITAALAKMNLPMLSGSGANYYDIYVIGSGSGGTGSGGFLEMPALIKKAMQTNPYKISGILYMPDTLTTLVPGSANELMANGYATLKELNYYQGMYMRQGYSEVFTYSNIADPEIELHDKFFNAPYLIGSTGVPTPKASAIAQEVIAEFLVTLLVDATKVSGAAEPFVSTAMMANAETVAAVDTLKYKFPANPNLPAIGCSHEYPSNFGSIGFAQAEAPEKLVRAYAVEEVCKKAGLKPEDSVARDNMAAQGEAVLPFRDRSDMLTVAQAKAEVQKIVEPLMKIHGQVKSGSFNLMNDMGVSPDALTFKDVKANAFTPILGTPMTNKIDSKVGVEMPKLKSFIQKQYAAYKANVEEYVKKEGPYAFVNLFYGRFIPQNGDAGTGIKDILQNLVSGKAANGMGTAYDVNAVANAKAKIESAKNKITGAGALTLPGTKTSMVNEWLSAVNTWGSARINEALSNAAYGPSGYLDEGLMTPALLLTEQLNTFGDVLASLSDIYKEYSDGMQDFGKFCNSFVGETVVNICAVDHSAYQWLKQKADDSASKVNAKSFRDNLIDDFFDNPTAWLEVPDNLVTISTTGGVSLTSPDNPVPARVLFDNFATKNIQLDVNVTILDLFEQLQKQGIPFDNTANLVVSQLMGKSQVRFNGKVNTGRMFTYLQYPDSLNQVGGNGSAVVKAITQAAVNNGINATNIYPSSDSDSIVIVQQAVNMEMYRVAGLESWEKQYEQKLKTVPCLIHGKSPDVELVSDVNGMSRYKENMPWKDFESIVQRDDPEKKDPTTGLMSREGEQVIKLRNMIAEAKDLGVLYAEQGPNGWVIKRVYFDKSREWKFNITMCSPDANTGLLPQGLELVKAAAQQNNVPLASLERVVELNYAGLLSAPAASEDYAWQNAIHVLRAHQPMYREVRKSMETVKPWNAQVSKFNGEILKGMRPAMMAWLLKAGMLHRLDNGTWVYETANGQQTIANYSSAMLPFVPPAEKYDIDNGLLGYELFKRIDAAYPDDLLAKEMERAKQHYNYLMTNAAIDDLQKGLALYNIVEDEAKALTAKGANNGALPVPYAYGKAMADFHMKDEQLAEVAKFYSNFVLWANI